MAFLPSHVFQFSPASFNPATVFDFSGSIGTAENAAISAIFSAALDAACAANDSAVSGDSVSANFAFNCDYGDIAPTSDQLTHEFSWNCAFDDFLSSQDEFNRRWAKRYVILRFSADLQSTQALFCEKALTQGSSRPLTTEIAAEWQAGRLLADPVQSVSAANTPKSQNWRFLAENAQPLQWEVASHQDWLILQSLPIFSAMDSTKTLKTTILAGFDVLELIRSKTVHPVDDSSQTVHEFTRLAYGRSSEPFYRYPWFDFGNSAFLPANAFAFNALFPEIHLVDTIERGGIRHGNQSKLQVATRQIRRFCAIVDKTRKPPPGQSFIPADPPRDPPVTPPGHILHTIPGRPFYMINHNLSVTLLDGTPITMESVNLSLDVDSYAWNFSGNLADKADLALVQPPPNADPVQLLVTINTLVFKVMVERIQHSWQFGQRQISLSGRSLAALLGQPYQQPQSATQSSVLTIQQLAELQLPLGWTITWDMPVWNVPATAFTYTLQTPIQVLLGMANDIGAIVKPHRSAQSMTFMPRYKAGPWQFAAATPDLLVPEAAILNITLRPPAKLDINGVYVHGGEVGGVIGWCRLNGTDGARLAPTVSNSLMTDVAAARALGERILAANQTQPAIESITIPMDNGDFPLAEVGWLVQITADGVPVRGIINSVALQVTLGSVRQTLQIGEETPNNWTLFKDLLPRDPLLVGTLSVTDGVTSLITLLDGGVVRVRGTGTVNNKYYIRAGRIDGEAPDLVQSEIVV